MKQKRVPCPYCAELIQPTAKVCRFCNKNVIKQEKTYNVEKPFSVWVVCLLIFLISLFFIRRADVSETSWLIILSFVGIVVLIGFTFFIKLVKNIIFIPNMKRAAKYLTSSIIVFCAFFSILNNLDVVEAKLGFKPVTKEEVKVTPSPTVRPLTKPATKPTPTKATQLPQQKTVSPATNTGARITCTGPDGKTFQATKEECDSFNTAWGNAPTPDPNEYVRCTIHENCGGGYREMTRKSCENMTCCQVGGTWQHRAKDQCNKEQRQESETQWITFCNDLWDPDDCSTYWETGSQYWYDCRSDKFDGRADCYNRY